MHENNNNNIKKLLGSFIGLCIIYLMLWNRFLRERMPKTIQEFASTYLKIIIIISIISFIIRIFITICELIQYKRNPNKFIAKISNSYFVSKLFDSLYPLLENIKKTPEKVYFVFFNKFNISHIVEIPFFKLSRFLMELPIKYSYILTMIHVCLYTMPKIIPPLIFVLEILLYHRLECFYKVIILYAIVLIYDLLLWVLGHLADNNIFFATAHIKIMEQNKDGFTAKFQEEVPKIDGAIDIILRKNDKGLLEWFGYIYETYCDIKWLVYRLGLERKKLKDYEVLFISFMYLIGWSYILYYICL